MRNKME